LTIYTDHYLSSNCSNWTIRIKCSFVVTLKYSNRSSIQCVQIFCLSSTPNSDLWFSQINSIISKLVDLKNVHTVWNIFSHKVFILIIFHLWWLIFQNKREYLFSWCGDRMIIKDRTTKTKLGKFFNKTFRNENTAISRSTVERTVRRFNATDIMKNRQIPGRWNLSGWITNHWLRLHYAFRTPPILNIWLKHDRSQWCKQLCICLSWVTFSRFLTLS